MIHMRDGDFLYSSTKSEKSFGRMKVVGMMSRSGQDPPAALPPPLDAPPELPPLATVTLTSIAEPGTWGAFGAAKVERPDC